MKTILFSLLPRRHKQFLKTLRVISCTEVIEAIAANDQVAVPDTVAVKEVLGEWLSVVTAQVGKILCIDAPRATYNEIIYLHPKGGMFVTKD